MIRYGWNLCAVLFHHVLTYVTLNPGNCNFDYGLCGWTLQQDPYYPRTWDSDDGINYYIHLGSYDWQTHRLLLESVPLEASGLQCLIFDFKTSRYRPEIPFMGDLSVSLVHDRFQHHLVYLQEGKYDNVWQRFFLNVDNVQNYMDVKIRFSASVTSLADIYIDNIQFLEGSCRLECNFENDICGIPNSTFQKIAYSPITGKWHDHTSNEVGGHYLYLEGIRKSATFENIHFFLCDFQCITFWYRIYGHTSTISVLVEEHEKATTLSSWIRSGEYIDTWLPAAINVEVRNRTLVQIRISGATVAYYDKIGLDDIAITSVSCLDCNFRDGFCNWDTNSTWRITSNGSKYAYPVCNVGKESALISRSEVFQGEKCLSLLHFIEDNVKTYIEVRTQIGWNTVWDNIREKESRVWTTTHININLTTPSRIYISVIQRYGCSKRYFISSISLKQGRCEEPTTISVPATTSKTQYNASYTSIRTTAARKSTSTAFAAADAPTITTTANTTQTTSYNNRTNEFDTENKELQMTKEGSSEVSIGVIIGIVIGCLVLAGAVSLVAVYMYRRRYVSSTKTKTSSKGTLKNRSFSGILKTENEDKSVASSIEKNDKCNLTSGSAYYNVQAEYATVEKKCQPHKQTQHIACSADEGVYSLAGAPPDTDFKILSHAVEIGGINRENINTENNYQYDTVYEMRKTLSDSTYNHTNEFHDDAYASTIPGSITPSDETYSHSECKSTLDSIYTNTNFTDECTHNTTIKSSDQDCDQTYNNICSVVDEDNCTIIHTTTKDTGNAHDHTL